MSTPVKIAVHFFIGLCFLGVGPNSGQLTAAYYIIVIMYYVAKWYIKTIRATLGPTRQNYFFMVYPAAVIGFIFSIFLSTLPSVSNESIGGRLFLILPFSLICHFVCFLLFCFLYSLFLLPIRFRRARLQKQQRRDAEIENQRILDETHRLQAEHDMQNKEIAERKAFEEQRRIDARAACELFYNQHLSEVSQRFPRAAFDAFMQTYMSSQHPADAVERRGRELQRIIQHHRDAIKPAQKFQSIQEIAEWYLREKQNIESLPIDDQMRQEQLIGLDKRYSELSTTMLETMGR